MYSFLPTILGITATSTTGCHYHVDTKDITILSEVKNKMQMQIHFFWDVILC